MPEPLLARTDGGKALAVEPAEQVFPVGPVQDPERPAGVPFHGKLEQVGALIKAVDPALFAPLFQVGRGMKNDRLPAARFVVNGHDPAVRCRVPEEARVSARVLHDRVAFELGPGPPPVVAERDALAPPGAGVRQDERV